MREAMWSRGWRERGQGWPHIISCVAGHNPAEVKRIVNTCNYTEVVEAYISSLADSEFALEDK